MSVRGKPQIIGGNDRNPWVPVPEKNKGTEVGLSHAHQRKSTRTCYIG